MVKIVLSAIWYPMCIARYYQAALNRRDDVEVLTVGPYTGATIPWGGGMNLPEKYAIPPDILMPHVFSDISLAPISLVEDRLPSDFEPDLWLQIDAGYSFLMKPKRGINAIVATDPHVLNYDRQRNEADVFYCMQAHYCQQVRDHYLPYAFDPVWHAPMEDVAQTHDCTLLGLHYENRNALVESLRREGVRVHYELGIVFDEARQIYNQAPIGLNWSSLNDLTARVFELLGMKRIAVVNWVPDLDKHFQDGIDLITFRSLQEAVAKVKWCLEHPALAGAIAERGHQTVQRQSWDVRVNQILEETLGT
jgi:hypothetical protein